MLVSALSSRLGFTHYSFPYIETTYIVVARWEVRLQAAVEAGQRAISRALSRPHKFSGMFIVF